MLLKAKQVAERLGVSPSFVYALMDRQELPYIQIPGTATNLRRVDPSDLDQWIAAHKTEAA